MTALETIIAVLGLLGVSGVISGLILHKVTMMERNSQMRSNQRAEESILIMRGIKCSGNLGMATADAIKTGRANGEVSAAENEYKEFCNDLDSYLLRRNAERK